MSKILEACLIVIGDEILSGRTEDQNVNYLALWLAEKGIDLAEVRIIPDKMDVIVNTVNECRAKWDYIFTTGGIGPTHDDITAAAIAKAFSVSVIRSAEAMKMLAVKMGGAELLTEARLKMADIPEGGSLIINSISGAPGFQMENVYTLAGIPAVMQVMLDGLQERVGSGITVKSKALYLFEGESIFAGILERLENKYSSLSVGSYPAIMKGKIGATFILRSRDDNDLAKAYNELKVKITDLGVEFFEGEWYGK
jgi:molybdenum cofactor synthesis domain-containing protein